MNYLKLCYVCGSPSTKLCDGKKKSGTCDRPMCEQHVKETNSYLVCIRGKGIGKSCVETTDYCQDCAGRQFRAGFLE